MTLEREYTKQSELEKNKIRNIKMQTETLQVAKNMDSFLAEVEWFSKLGLTSRGLRLLLNVYLDEGQRIAYYNAKVNQDKSKEEQEKAIGKTSGYFTSFERMGLVTKVPDETDVRGQAKKVYLTYKVKETFNKLLPLLCLPV